MGHTLYLIVMKEEKSLEYTLFRHRNEGRKECGVHCFFPIVMKEEKSVEYTVLLVQFWYRQGFYTEEL